MWGDGNTLGSWVDFTPWVLGLALIAALYVGAVLLIVNFASRAADGEDVDGGE